MNLLILNFSISIQTILGYFNLQEFLKSPSLPQIQVQHRDHLTMDTTSLWGFFGRDKLIASL